jgi:hypothetical protein
VADTVRSRCSLTANSRTRAPPACPRARTGRNERAELWDVPGSSVAFVCALSVAASLSVGGRCRCCCSSCASACLALCVLVRRCSGVVGKGGVQLQDGEELVSGGQGKDDREPHVGEPPAASWPLTSCYSLATVYFSLLCLFRQDAGERTRSAQTSSQRSYRTSTAWAFNRENVAKVYCERQQRRGPRCLQQCRRHSDGQQQICEGG